MKKLSSTEAELKKSLAYKKVRWKKTALECWKFVTFKEIPKKAYDARWSFRIYTSIRTRKETFYRCF